jgi:hypothetical protein
VCGEKFHAAPGKVSKSELFKQFDAHLYATHRRQWDTVRKKLAGNQLQRP